MSEAAGAARAVRRRALLAWAVPLLVLLAVCCDTKKQPARLFRSQGRYTAIVQELVDCNDIPSDVIIMQNYTQHFGPEGDPLVNGMVQVTRSMKSIVKGEVTFTKCTEEGTLCEPLLVLRPDATACEFWQRQNVFWTPLVNSMWSTSSPRPHHPWCPVEADFWAIRNATFDLDRFARMCPFPLTNSVWEIRLKAWDQDMVPWMCGYLRAKIIRFRNRPGHN